MKTRVISGVILVLILSLFVVFYDLIFANIIILFAFLHSLKEINTAFSEKNSIFALVILALAGCYYIMSRYLPHIDSIYIMSLFCLGYARICVFGFGHIEVKTVSSTLMFGLYSLIGFYSLSQFKTLLPSYEFGNESKFVLIMAIMVAWIGDSVAYFSGYLFGKHKMSPTLSPKKTIEGAVGGLIGSSAFAVAALFTYSKYVFNTTGVLHTISTKSVLIWALIGLVGYLFGIIGDLFASAVKRQVGIKDYANLIPGHGGILDRFDSVIIISPAFMAFASYIASNGGIFSV